MDYILRNEKLEVIVSSKGAELRSVVHQGRECMWCGDPSIWGRRAPLLFPLIGRLRQETYLLDGKVIHAPIHGFCRDREFQVVAHDDSHVILRTADDAQTQEIYPFSFQLEVEFALEEDAPVLRKTHRVVNNSKRPMPYEVGGHEAYAVSPDEDTYVQFEGGISQIGTYVMDEDAMLTVPKRLLELPQGRLEQTPEQVGLDTIIVEEVPNGTVTLATKQSGNLVTVEFPEFDYLGIWTKAGVGKARYLCIEPWSTLPDGTFMPHDLMGKTGIRILGPGQEESLTYSMAFH